MASIVIAGVVSLVDYPEAFYLWRVDKFDWCVWMFAFLGTLFLGVELGLAIAGAVSLLIVVYESAYPHTAVLGRLPGTHQYRNVKQYPDAERYEGVVMVRVDGPMNFASTQTVRDKIDKYCSRSGGQAAAAPGGARPAVRYVILDLGPVSYIDGSALHSLHEMAAAFRRDRETRLCLADPNRNVMQRLSSSGLADELGREHLFVSMHDALDYCLRQLVKASATAGDDDNDDKGTVERDDQSESSTKDHTSSQERLMCELDPKVGHESVGPFSATTTAVGTISSGSNKNGDDDNICVPAAVLENNDQILEFPPDHDDTMDVEVGLGGSH